MDEGIPERYQSNWKARIEGGASEPPLWTWQGGGWANWTLTLEFHAGATEGGGSGSREEFLSAVERKARWILALGAPRGRKRPPNQLRTNARPGDPPIVLVVFGSFMTLRCICLGTNLTWLPPFEPKTVQPYSAKLEIALQRRSGFYPDWYTIAEGKKTLTNTEQGTKYETGPTQGGRITIMGAPLPTGR